MVTAHGNMCSATLHAIEHILKVRPDAVFFQSETAEVFLEQWPETRRNVQFKNALRFITFDFLYGHEVNGDVLMFLMDNGVSREDYRSTLEYGRKFGPHCVMGLDYYTQNERILEPDGGDRAVGPLLGWHTIASQYYQRYRKPIMLTETNIADPERAPEWLWNMWHNQECLRAEGVPVIGYTWYSLQDQVDWDIQLREIRGQVTPNGLFTLDRTRRPVATAFHDLCERYRNLPVVESFPVGAMQGPPSLTSVEQKMETQVS